MGKHRSYIKLWRTYRGMKQREVVDRLLEMDANSGPGEKLPTTEASLSRIEKGEQNFNMATLSALAEILGAEEPGHLLTINPFGGVLKVLQAFDGLSDVQRDAALQVVEAMRQGASRGDIE